MIAHLAPMCGICASRAQGKGDGSPFLSRLLRLRKSHMPQMRRNGERSAYASGRPPGATDGPTDEEKGNK
jgi:hypothetical protein